MSRSRLPIINNTKDPKVFQLNKIYKDLENRYNVSLCTAAYFHTLKDRLGDIEVSEGLSFEYVFNLLETDITRLYDDIEYWSIMANNLLEKGEWETVKENRLCNNHRKDPLDTDARSDLAEYTGLPSSTLKDLLNRVSHLKKCCKESDTDILVRLNERKA